MIPHIFAICGYINKNNNNNEENPMNIRKMLKIPERSDITVAYKGHFCYMQFWYKLYPWIAVFTWLFSAFYHSKRVYLTEKCDLSFALILLTMGLFIVFRKFLGPLLHQPKEVFLYLIFISLLVWRIYHMMRGQIPFDIHMYTCFSIVSASICLWILWVCANEGANIFLNSIKRSDDTTTYISCNHGGFYHNKMRIILLQVYLILAACLELFDFPPIIGLMDAHSIWHASTITLTFTWYSFVQYDSTYFLQIQS
jgi:hypothetical protein